MNKFIAMLVALVLGASLGVMGAPSAAAIDCNDDRTNYARADVESEEAGVGGGVEVSISETSNYPVSVGYHHQGGGLSATNCSDNLLDHLSEDPEGAVQEVVAILMYIVGGLLP